MVGGQGAGAAMTMDATVRMAVQDVKGKEVTMKMTFEKIEMPMLTQAPPEQRKQFEDMFKKLAIVYVLDDQGRTVSVRAEGGPPGSESVFGSLGASGASAALPDGPVKVGDTYTSEQKVNNETVKATYKVLAFERKNGVEAVKMEMANSFRNTSQTMFVWIELATGMMVAAEGDMAIPAAQGGGSIRTTMSRI
jgi:hypothetical protein